MPGEGSALEEWVRKVCSDSVTAELRGEGSEGVGHEATRGAACQAWG